MLVLVLRLLKAVIYSKVIKSRSSWVIFIFNKFILSLYFDILKNKLNDVISRQIMNRHIFKMVS